MLSAKLERFATMLCRNEMRSKTINAAHASSSATLLVNIMMSVSLRLMDRSRKKCMPLVSTTPIIWTPWKEQIDVLAQYTTSPYPGLFTNVHRRGAKSAKITRRTGLKLGV
jgi:hypothetical protein